VSGDDREPRELNRDSGTEAGSSSQPSPGLAAVDGSLVTGRRHLGRLSPSSYIAASHFMARRLAKYQRWQEAR
jgi:hypothetical protein